MHAFTNQNKCITTQKLKPGLVASYNIWPGNGEGLLWFWRFINLPLTYLLRHLHTYLQPRTQTELKIYGTVTLLLLLFICWGLRNNDWDSVHDCQTVLVTYQDRDDLSVSSGLCVLPTVSCRRHSYLHTHRARLGHQTTSDSVWQCPAASLLFLQLTDPPDLLAVHQQWQINLCNNQSVQQQIQLGNIRLIKACAAVQALCQ